PCLGPGRGRRAPRAHRAAVGLGLSRASRGGPMAAGEGVQQRLARLDSVLRQVPYQYEQKDRLRNDVASLLRSSDGLQPAAQQFTGGGKSATLFYLTASCR
ncbi:unnamed protein product, partial [Prorocentrum cordatum]